MYEFMSMFVLFFCLFILNIHSSFVCTCLCVVLYIYVCVCMYMCVCARMCVYICLCVRLCVSYFCVNKYIYMHIYIYMCVCVFVSMYACICLCRCTSMHVHMFVEGVKGISLCFLVFLNAFLFSYPLLIFFFPTLCFCV